jgi:hypothetical protein
MKPDALQTFNWECYGAYQTAGADNRLFATLMDAAPRIHQSNASSR